MIYNLHKFLEKKFFCKKVLTSAVMLLSRVSPSKFCFRTNQGTSVPSYMFLLRSEVSYIFFQSTALTISYMLNQVLWFNRFIQIATIPVLYINFSLNNMNFLTHLVGRNGGFNVFKTTLWNNI